MEERGVKAKPLSLAAGKNETLVRDLLDEKNTAPNPRMDTILALANALKVDASSLLQDNPLPPLFESADLPSLPKGLESPSVLGRDVPVIGTASAGSEGDFVLNGDVIDYVRRPPLLQHVQQAFAVYVEGESMSPWREPGQLVYCHPSRPVRIGDYVLVELYGGQEEEVAEDYHNRPCLLKKLVRRAENTLTLEQFNPRKILEIDSNKVRKIYRVIDWPELLGM